LSNIITSLRSVQRLSEAKNLSLQINSQAVTNQIDRLLLTHEGVKNTPKSQANALGKRERKGVKQNEA